MNLGLKLWPDVILQKKTHQVADFSEILTEKSQAMFRLLDSMQGLGLAGPQAGLSESIIVFNVEGRKETLVNPIILQNSEDKQTLEEGCLSFPGFYVSVTRSKTLTVQYQDLGNNTQTIEASGMLAQVLQHEIDHLEGKVFTKYLSKLKRDYAHSKMNKFKKKVILRRQEYERQTRELEQQSGKDSGLYDFSLPRE